MTDCPDDTALPSRRSFLNGALRLAAVLGGVSLLIASTRKSASAAHSRTPETIAELDAEPSISWGEWTGWRFPVCAAGPSRAQIVIYAKGGRSRPLRSGAVP